MGFFTGFATGFAKSVDDQLKKDMERTDKRLDGMEQYRVTRRRAELERKAKEKDELRDVLTNLASFVEGDEDKAIQLYKAGGGTITAGQNLYAELLENQQAGKDVGAALTFAEVAEQGDFTSFINRNITPVKPLPMMEDEMKASGLYGLFKPDLTRELSRRVDEAAPLPEVVEGGPAYTAQATIDRSGFLKPEEVAAAKKREQVEITGLELAQEQMQSSMDLAEKAENRLQELQDSNASQRELDNAFRDKELALATSRFDQAKVEFEKGHALAAKADARADRLEAENADQRDIDNARAFAADQRAMADLKIAEAAAYRDAVRFTQEQELTGLQIEEQKLINEKRRNAPQFSTYEAMLVAAEQKISEIEAIPEAQRSADDKQTLANNTAIRDRAISGINKVAQAESTTTYTPVFSKQSIDSVINAEIKRQLTPVGMYDSIEDKVKTIAAGNKLTYFTKMQSVYNAVEQRYKDTADTTLTNTLAAQRDVLKKEIAAYKNSLATDAKVDKQQVTRDQLKDKQFQQSLEPGTVLQYKNGDVTVTTVWTGNGYI